MTSHFPAVALSAPRILLPRAGIDLDKWAVIACDQHTSHPEYWEEVAGQVQGSPSALHLVFPEVYLGEEDRQGRIKRINQTMRAYLRQGVMEEKEPGFVLVDRQTPHAASRKGLVVALDLEHYDFQAGSQSLIRATEGTALERLPPRIEVRRDAPLEIPHIMVLIDDPDHTVIEPLLAEAPELLYDVQLMLGGGRVKGYHITGADRLAQVASALGRLADPERFAQRYGMEAAPLLYAMGDGNHSFATAREVWRDIKAQAPDSAAVLDHPARHALVELVNLHDDGLDFEPIHRVLFDLEADALLTHMQAFYQQQGAELTVRYIDDAALWQQTRDEQDGATCQYLPFIAAGRRGLVTVRRPFHPLGVAALQIFLEEYGRCQPQTVVDYIHGDEAVDKLGGQSGNLGFYTQAIDKHALFRTILAGGALPRKTFSMGEAEEKRYYLEARRIQG
ncbi:MAG: DUF1015 family protein [Candidatus Latescibacteria bacterium]|nr:DUF1015 family protein [Candidatus Latescibacterota bacterium]